eukprot:c6494_g1_i1.p1 GENE.c6494_g1_i1~~c6494_g1_i1.p1  ORF type:complete len:256 (-),score=51.60 c6494_g1_i1:18-785(-)
MDEITEVPVASGIFTCAAMLNHHCAPNSLAQFRGTSLIVRAIDDIAPNSSITISYGPRYGESSKQARQEIISEKYNFKCSCDACCQRQDPGVACTAKNRCASTQHCTCNAAHSTEQSLLESQQKVLRALSSSPPQRCVPLALNHLSLCSKVCVGPHPLLAQAHDMCARVSVEIGALKDAVSHSVKSFELVGALFGERSIEAANEGVKLVSVCHAAGDGARVREFAPIVLEYLEVYLDDAHPDRAFVSDILHQARE